MVRPMQNRNKSGKSGNYVSYSLMERLADFLICSRCFRQNRHQPIRRPLSQYHQPVALCRKCSAELNGAHQADLVLIDRPQFKVSY